MDMSTAFQNLNWLAIVLSSVSAFLLGFVWYSLLFPKAWMRENGFTEESNKNSNMLKIFGLSFLFMLFAAFNLAMFIGKGQGVAGGAMAGFLAGLGWVFTFIGVTYMFEKKSFTLLFINGGYSVVSLTLMGIIIGLMQ
ncbi:MAG: DUF1761 domain-containing protein [Bacteroidales bacterium]